MLIDTKTIEKGWLYCGYFRWEKKPRLLTFKVLVIDSQVSL